MKIGVYFCHCGSNISDKINPDKVKDVIERVDEVAYFDTVDFMCGEEGKEEVEAGIKENQPDRIVIAACSPRDHENTFRKVCIRAGLNPYLMQMVNIREHIAWVTADSDKAVAKANAYIKAAIARVKLHEPLEKEELEILPNVLVIGAGPAGLKTSLSLAEAGRKVTLVEKSPLIGGLPVSFDEVFPNLECGPCMLEPILDEVLHGEVSENIEILTLSEIEDVAGYFGNFIVKVRQKPRYINLDKCIGCGECIGPCPVSTDNEFNYNLDKRKAIAMPFLGALPNAPFIDDKICLRSAGYWGQGCVFCRNACPVPEAVNYDDVEKIHEKKVGAIVLAVGSDTYDVKKIPELQYGKQPDVYTSLEFERILTPTGPTEGVINTMEGEAPKTAAIVHCVGSLDKNHMDYCSAICCQSAFKYNKLISKHHPETKIVHFYKELSLAGKEEFFLYNQVRGNPNTSFVRYKDITDLHIKTKGGKQIIEYKNSHQKNDKVNADLVILCPALVPSKEIDKLNQLLDTTVDHFGFFEELHSRIDSVQTKIRGIYIAGTCQAPVDIQKTMNQGMAASGYILSSLVEGRKIEIDPIKAWVDQDICAACGVCGTVCPYKAISFNEKTARSYVNKVLCHGCGTCVAACPVGAIIGNHFTNDAIYAEIEEVLA